MSLIKQISVPDSMGRLIYPLTRIRSVFSPFQVDDTIIVSGSPRSGTTWLGETLASSPGYVLSQEPMNLDTFPAAAAAGFDWRTYLEPSDQASPRLVEYMGDILTGKVGRFRPNSISDIPSLFTSDKLLIKFIRVSRCLGWILNTHPVKAAVSVIRHPCAVVASQLRWRSSWKGASPPDDIATGYGGQLPEDLIERFGQVLEDVSTREEALAAGWALDQTCTLRDWRRHQLRTTEDQDTENQPSWWLVSYEELLMQEDSTIGKLFDALSIRSPGNLEQTMTAGSWSSSQSLNLENKQHQLVKWRDHLSPTQSENILQIVERFDLLPLVESLPRLSTVQASTL